jgi:FkbM family methyltransferase
MFSYLKQFAVELVPQSWRLRYRKLQLQKQYTTRKIQILNDVFYREIPSLYPNIAKIAGKETLDVVRKLAESFCPRNSSRVLHSISWPLLRHPVFLRENTSDVAIFCQVIVLEQYKPIISKIATKSPFIIDCGSNIGLSSAWLLSQFPAAKIVTLEPEEENYKLGCRNLAAYVGQYEALQAAVWSKSGETLFLMNPKETSWGFQFGLNMPSGNKSHLLATPTIGLNDIVQKSPTGRCDLLKIDIEGGEKELFQHDSDEWLNRTLNLAIEIHGEVCDRAVSVATDKLFSSRWQDGEVTFFTEHVSPSSNFTG